MSSKFNNGPRGLFPPPICKKVPDPPPLVPFPLGPVMLTFLAAFTDDYDYDYKFHWRGPLHQVGELEWSSEPAVPLPFGDYARMNMAPDYSYVDLEVTWERYAGDMIYFNPSGIQLGAHVPFHVGPLNALFTDWNGYATIECAQM